MKALVLACILLSYLQSSAQNEWFYFPDEVYFVKEVSVKEFRGKTFKYQVAVDARASDTFSKVRINGVGVGKGNDDFLNNSAFTKNTHKENGWTIHTITGQVPQEAWKLWFYNAVNGNGEYFFDNVRILIEENGEWIELELSNGSFENKSRNIFDGYYVSTRKSSHLKAELTNNHSFHGEQSLHISTFGLLPTSPKSLSKQ